MAPLNTATTLALRRSGDRVAARCMNPDCSNQCRFSGSKGRPARFCSDLCRRIFARNRERILADLATIDSAWDDPEIATGRSNELRTARARSVWMLDRYGGA